MIFENDILYYTIKTMLCIAGTFGMMVSGFRYKYTKFKTLFGFALYIVYVGIITYIIVKSAGVMFFLRSCAITINLPAVILMFILSPYSPWQSIFRYMMQVSVSMLMMALQTILVTALNGNQFADFFIRLGSYAIVIILEAFILRKKLDSISCLPDKNWRTLVLVPVAFMAFLSFLAVYPVHFTKSVSNMFFIFLFMIIMFIVYFIIFVTLKSQYNLQMSEYANALLTSQANMLKNQLEVLSESEKQLKILRHDMKHYANGIIQLINNGNSSEILKYADSVKQKIDSETRAAYCENSAVNAILNYYIEKANRLGVKTEIRFSAPESADFNLSDFTVMLSNALDNSINACMSQPPYSEKKIRIRVSASRQYIIEIANTYSGKIIFNENGLPVPSSKECGIGSQSISAFAEKNGAILNYDVDEKWFRLRIIASSIPKKSCG